MDDDLITPDDDDEQMDNVSNYNNMSGSYSNLFRDKLDDDQQTGDSRNLNSTKLAPQLLPQTKVTNDFIENVYCNITPQLLPPADGQSTSEQSDPSLHVYSNVENNGNCDIAVVAIVVPTPTTTSQTTTTTSTPTTTKSNKNGTAKNSNSVSHRSSTLLSDDLDLDDPVMAVGSFGAKNRAKNISAPSSMATGKTIVSMEMKHVTLSTPAAISSTNGDRLNAPKSSIAANANNTSNAFISPSRMRLLHDTTMIDTALDLDSLDESSLGNNSQACLVNKTAIV